MSWKWRLAQWLELRWWKRYLQDKSKVEYLEWKRNYWQQVLEKTPVQIDSSDKVADIGCGPAGIFIALQNHSVTAIDPLLDSYERATSFFKRADYPNVHFVSCPIEEMNTGKKFDLVFCMNAINHVRDIEKGVRKLKEICTDKGSIVVSIDVHNHSLFKILFRLVPGDVLHPHQYDLEEYEQMINQDGWEISEPVLLKKNFFFNHYVLVGRRKLS